MRRHIRHEAAVSTESRQRIWKWLAPRVLPAILIALGIAIGGWITAKSSTKTPPNFGEAAVLVVAAAALNLLGGALLGRIGRVQPGHARSAVRRLLRAGRSVRGARFEITEAIDSRDAMQMFTSLARTDARLEDLEGVLADSIADWNDVHPEALRSVMETEPNV
jgi:hypothetical protein